MTERLHEFFAIFQEELKSCSSTNEAQCFAIERQVTRARKRARINKSGLAEQAVESFIANNSLVRGFTPSLPPDVEIEAKQFIRTLLERYTYSQDEESIQTTLDLRLIYDNWRFGPGASHEVKGTHAAVKISQDMTCTASCEPLVERLRQLNPYLARYDCERGVTGTNVVLGSRLETVPKNEDTERTIAIEPSGNMCLQLAAGTYLEGALRYAGLDIRTQQPLNKAAALRGSLYDSLATIDMKSASDLIGMRLVSRLLPREWVWFLETVRSPSIRLPNGEWLKLEMISTMGNGFTFPLMTLIISALIYAYRRVNGGPNQFIDWSDTCVFGDDVIVPSHEYQGVCDVLTAAGFLINTEKSFSAGPFRESCGGDYWCGQDVTPIYVKDLSTSASVYVAINQVLEWSERIKVFPLRSLLYLKTLLNGKVLLVPEWCNPDSGILTSQVKRRYKYLSPIPLKRSYEDTIFSVMLACGGYISASATLSVLPPDQKRPEYKVTYTPRPRRTRYRMREARLPRGYLDGWDPDKRSRRASDGIAAVVAVLFA